MSEFHTMFPTLTKTTELERFIQDMHSLAYNFKLHHCLRQTTGPLLTVIQNVIANPSNLSATAEQDGVYYEMPDSYATDYQCFPGTIAQNIALIQQFKRHISTDILAELDRSITSAQRFLIELTKYLQSRSSTQADTLRDTMLNYKMTETQTVEQYLIGFYALKNEAESLAPNNAMLAELCTPKFYIPRLIKNLVPILRGHATYLSKYVNTTWSEFKEDLLKLANNLEYTPSSTVTTSALKQVSFLGTSHPGSPPPAEQANFKQNQQSQGSRVDRGTGGSQRGNRRGGSNNFNNSYSHQSSRRGTPYTKVICHFCRKPGHYAKECRSRLAQQRAGNNGGQSQQQYQTSQQPQYMQMYMPPPPPPQTYLPPQPQMYLPPLPQITNGQPTLQITHPSNQSTSVSQATFQNELENLFKKYCLSSTSQLVSSTSTQNNDSTAGSSSTMYRQESLSDEFFH
jgi:hypothetical protein